jgi:hypothetical protein
MSSRPALISPSKVWTISLGLTLLAFLLAPRLAHASDTFRLSTPPTVEMGVASQEPIVSGCWYEPTGVFAGEGAVGTSEITGDADPFKCNENESEWQAYVYLAQSPKNAGLIDFEPRDPDIGSSSLSCRPRPAIAEDEGYSPIERLMTTEVDGDSCTADFLPGTQTGKTDFAATKSRAYAGHVRFVDSLAPVAGGRAEVRVDVFGLGNAGREVTVGLRSAGGAELGSAERRLRVGDQPRTVSVPLSAGAEQTLKSHHELRVHASVDIAAAGGTGDRTSELLLRRASSRR